MTRKLLSILCLSLALSVGLALKPARSEAGIVFLVKAITQGEERPVNAAIGGLAAVFGGVTLAHVGNCMGPNALCALAGVFFLVLDDQSNAQNIAKFSQVVSQQYGAGARDAENVAVILQNAARDAAPRDGQLVISVSERDLRDNTSLEYQASAGFAKLVADLR